MTSVVPAELEEVVYAAAAGVVGEISASELAAAVVDRSKRYTSDRDRLSAPTDKRMDLAARAMFFTLADAMKVAIPLAELASQNAIPARRPLRVVDVGAGCGAMSLGLVTHLVSDARGGAAFDITAIDRDVDALRIAGAAVRGLAAKRDSAAEGADSIDLNITTRAADVATTHIPACDLVVMGTVLNELSSDARLDLVQRALAAIADDGAVIVIEPALRDTSRNLHELRDAILASGAAHVFAPCTRRCAPCPALADPDDWCHEDRIVELPPRTHELARVTGLRDGGMKFSYLTLRKDSTPLVAGEHAWRVVSQPRAPKGKHELIGCGEPGRVTLRLLKRNRVEANRAFERARRGDVIVADAPVVDERVEIERETPVTRVEPARR